MVVKSKPKNQNKTTTTTTTSSNNSNNNCKGVIGKGKITACQVAYIVDRYLSDNQFDQTRSAFLIEASSLISNSNHVQAPKSLMSLEELLNEYIWLKGQKVLIEQEKCGLAQEKCRINTLLQGMQGVMSTYNSSAAANCFTPPPLPVLTSVSTLPTSMSISASAGYPASRTHVITSFSTSKSMKMNRTNFLTPISSSRPPRKRRNNYKDLETAPQAPKKVYCGPLANYPFSGKVTTKSVGQSSSSRSSKQSLAIQSSSPSFVQGETPIQGSSVAKNLFDNPSKSSTKTPPRAVSSQSDESKTPMEDVSSTAISNNTNNPSETTPTKCTITSSKTVIVSPTKHYSIERNECTFSSPTKTNFKRHCRLDFDSSDVPLPSSLENESGDGTATSESEKEGDIFNMDLPNFDAFGPDFSLTELLTDFGIDCENLDHSWPTTAFTSTDGVPESADDKNDAEQGTSQDVIKHSSEMTEIAVDKAVTGSDSVTSVKSVRKSIRIASPAKCSENSAHLNQENAC